MRRLLPLLLALATAVPRIAAQTDVPAIVPEGTAYERQAANFGEVLAQRLDTLLLDPLTQRTLVAIYVYDLTDDRPLYTHNHRQTIRPASNMKVITAIAALDLLGGDYRLRTSLHADAGAAAKADGEFAGNLYVRGGFDPDFGAADLAAFIAALRSEGIRRIRGDVLLDVSMKDTARLGWGWCWDDNADTNPVLTPLPYEGKDQFAALLTQQLRTAGISMTGRIRKGRLPQGGRTRLLCERSHSIDQLLQPMMKQSDNFYAEALFYQMAARGGQPYASRKQAYTHISALVERVGLNPQDYTFADGSGVSLYNYASPELFVRLLRYAYQTPDIYRHLLPSLPVAGVDGTLKKRMTEGSALRNVQAKTGTVTGISTLAGYATAPDGHRLCFSIMNSGQQRAAPARNFQNRVCQAMTQPW